MLSILLTNRSYGNLSKFPRRAAVLNYVKDGVKSESDEPLQEGIPVVKRGEKLSGSFFPLLYPAQ
jgi:hypothetical protein